MEKILVIEDEKDIAELEKDYLEISGFEVDVAHNGKVGLEKALDGDYSLIIVDIMLPDLDGFEICKSIREVKDVPIIMVTAKQDSIDKIRGLGLGADDYVVKPFDPQELVARVKRNVERYKSTEKVEKKGNAIEFEDIVINSESRQVLKKGKEIKLTNREFDLLEFLAKNPNIVFTKETLFDKIWGMDAFGDVSTVTVHVNRIREKVEDNPSKPRYIETVWGTGYKFADLKHE